MRQRRPNGNAYCAPVEGRSKGAKGVKITPQRYGIRRRLPEDRTRPRGTRGLMLSREDKRENQNMPRFDNVLRPLNNHAEKDGLPSPSVDENVGRLGAGWAPPGTPVGWGERSEPQRALCGVAEPSMGKRRGDGLESGFCWASGGAHSGAPAPRPHGCRRTPCCASRD